MLAAYAIGAAEVVLYVNATFARSLDRLASAIHEATSEGYLGERVGVTDFALSVRVHRGPKEYVASEDTAALQAIEGREPVPLEKPPYPTTVGLHGKPTVVNNVETLACIPPIVHNGAEWFRSQGTPDNPGTMLFTLPGNVRRPGVVELPIGTPLRELIEEHGGGLANGKAVKAVLPGGPSCGWIGAADLDVAMDRVPLAEKGSSLGCGALRILEEGECVVEVVDELAQFFMREACGQCPACTMETQTLAKITEKVRVGRGTAQMLDQVPKLAAFVKGKGLCSLVSMPAPPILSAIRLFPDDFFHHIEHGSCPSAS